jgi:NAD(P)-dependent dehydrogenase (short-subunit alcohol dehydrogenase family)
MRLLITGSTGIAAATATYARAAGHHVVTVGLDESADVRADLRGEAEARLAVGEARTSLGGFDALFNCAGISGRRHGDGPLHECTAEGFDETMRSNLRSLFLVSREVLADWVHREQQGVILNMGSVTAFHPEPVHFATHAYAAAKGAIEALTVSAAAYYARHRIRINAIAPGLVRTPMSQRAQASVEVQAFIRHKQPISAGMIEPEPIARAALFLLSEDSAPITGQILKVDGGWAVSA